MPTQNYSRKKVRTCFGMANSGLEQKNNTCVCADFAESTAKWGFSWDLFPPASSLHDATWWNHKSLLHLLWQCAVQDQSRAREGGTFSSEPCIGKAVLTMYLIENLCFVFCWLSVFVFLKWVFLWAQGIIIRAKWLDAVLPIADCLSEVGVTWISISKRIRHGKQNQCCSAAHREKHTVERNPTNVYLQRESQESKQCKLKAGLCS